MTELRFALRQLRKSPGFTIVAVLTLAIGIGANTAIFTVVNAVLLKPLPFPQPEQLVAIGGRGGTRDRPGPGLDSLSFPDFFDYRSQNKSFTHLAAYRERSFALAAGAEAQKPPRPSRHAGFFRCAWREPQLGRAFEADEAAPGGGAGGYTAVLSDEFWKRHFKGDPGALGTVHHPRWPPAHDRRRDAARLPIPDPDGSISKSTRPSRRRRKAWKAESQTPSSAAITACSASAV